MSLVLTRKCPSINWKQFQLHVSSLFIVSCLIQLIYLFALPISFEGDAGGYLSYAKLFTHIDGTWFQYWRPPGYPLYLHILGVTWGETFYGVIAMNAAMGVAMPLLVYGTLHPFGKHTAYIAALAFALSSLPFSYTKVMITEHPYAFFLLLGAFGFSRFVVTKAPKWAAVVITALFLAMMMRNEAGYILLVAIVMLFAQCRERRQFIPIVACSLVCLILTLSWSWKRAEIMQDPTVFGSLSNFTGRQMFWRVYYAVGNGERINVSPSNGPASKQLDEMFPGLLKHPSHENNWHIGLTLTQKRGIIYADEFLKEVVQETIAAHPEILVEFAIHAIQYLGINLNGPILVWHHDVYEKMPFNIADAAKYTMHQLPGLWQQYTTSYRRKSKNLAEIHRIWQDAHNALRLGAGVLFALTVWFIPFAKQRWLAVFLFLSTGMLIGAGVLGFGFNVRYEHMILPFILMTAIAGMDGIRNVLRSSFEVYKTSLKNSVKA